MKIEGKVVVVTGGASGIGRGLCLRFAQEKARAVVVADTDPAEARAVAAEIDGLAVPCDVSKENEMADLVARTEDRYGAIDIFCSNVGIFMDGSVEVANESWQRIWEINVMSHIYAARQVIPGMLARGGGYFLLTASAAGLLSQIGATPYSVTKHAVIGLAESLAIDYGDLGIRVSALCPMAVHSKMTAGGSGIAGLDGTLTPEEVAEATVCAIGEERFMILPHTQVKKYFLNKASDYERWLSGMRRLALKFKQGELNLT